MASVKRRKLSQSSDVHDESPDSATIEGSVVESAPKTFKDLVCVDLVEKQQNSF